MYLPPINNIEEITEDPTLLALKPWWLVLIGSAILYWIPAQEVLALPIIGPTADWIAAAVPSVALWVERSAFPHNTKLFLVFAWVMVFVQTYWIIASPKARKYIPKKYLEKSAKKTKSFRVFGFFLSLMIYGFFVWIAFNFGFIDSDYCRPCVNASRLSQLWIVCISSFALSGLNSFLFLIFPLAFKSLLSKGNTHA